MNELNAELKDGGGPLAYSSNHPSELDYII